MTTMIARPLALWAAVLAACGGSPQTDLVRTGPAASDDSREDDATATVRALDEIAESSVCITPELCEDFRAWRPDALFVLDGHLTAVDRAHAFVRVGDAWTHQSLPEHGEVTSNGSSLFFCDRTGGVFELSLTGLERRGTLPDVECAVVVASGPQLYVVTGHGPVLRQDGNRWSPLEFELRYGNGYSVDTVAMTRSRAFALSDRAELLELPAEGPSFEPRVVAQTHLGRMATMLAVPGTERIVATAGEESEGRRRGPAFAIVDGIEEAGTVRRVVRELDLPRAAGEPARASGATSNVASEDDDESEADEGEQVLDLGAAIVGLDPPMVARRRATFDGGAVGVIAIEHFLLTDTGWTNVATTHPEVFHIAVAQGAFGTDMPERTAPLPLGSLRIVINTYHSPSHGPRVTAWPRDAAEVALTVFDDPRDGFPAGCVGQEGDARCMMLEGGGFLRLTSVREGRRSVPRAIELLDATGAVLLAHAAPSGIESMDAAMPDRLYVAEADRPLGFVDASGYHPIVLPEPTRVAQIRALPAGRAYAFGADGQVFFIDGTTVARVSNAPAPALRQCHVAGDGCILDLGEEGFVWLHASSADRITLGDDLAPDVIRSLGRSAVALAAPNGTTWIVEGDEVSVVTAPTPDEAHRDAPVYFLPDAFEDPELWGVHFGHAGVGTQRYRTSAPTTRRSIGPLASFAHPYRNPLVRLRHHDPRDDEAAGPQPDSLLAYWERPDDTGMRPLRWVGSLVIADASMQNVVFLTQPGWPEASYDPPTAVARFVGGREVRTGRASGETVAAARARSLVTSTMTEASAFALERTGAGTAPYAGRVPSGSRAGEIVRVQVDGRRTVVLEVIDRGNSRATRIGTTPLPAGSVLTFAVAAVSGDGSHVAVAIGVRDENGEDAGAVARHLVLPLPAAPPAE